MTLIYYYNLCVQWNMWLWDLKKGRKLTTISDSE